MRPPDQISRDDLVRRLRGWNNPDAREAADAIDRLAALVDRVADAHDANCSPELREAAALARGRAPSDMHLIDERETWS